MFSVSTFDFFTRSSAKFRERPYYFDFVFERRMEAKITFERGGLLFLFHPFMEWLINKSTKMQELYEATFLSRLFPAFNIHITLVK